MPLQRGKGIVRESLHESGGRSENGDELTSPLVGLAPSGAHRQASPTSC